MEAVIIPNWQIFPKKLLIIVVLLFAVILAVDISKSHAESKHADTFAAVRKCISDGNSTRYFYDLKKNKYIGVCQINPTTFGFRIIKAISDSSVKERSAYIKDNIHSLDDLNTFITDREWIEVFNKDIIDLFLK